MGVERWEMWDKTPNTHLTSLSSVNKFINFKSCLINMEFKDYVNNTLQKFDLLKGLFAKEELVISYDTLSKEQKIDQELLYFKLKDKEIKGMFVFGFDFFVKELKEQEFKKMISQSSNNFKIYHAYNSIKKTQKKVKVSDILNKLTNERKDSLVVHKYLNKILSLAYYMNFKLEKAQGDIENDYYIEIPKNYLVKLKQRFNLDVIVSIYEDDNAFLFLNAKGVLNFVFKEKNNFEKNDIEKILLPILKKTFSIKEITFE